MPPYKQNLTQGLFLLREVWEGELGHESRFVRSWLILIIGSLSAM